MSRDINNSKYSDPLYTGENYQPNFMDMSPSKMFGGVCMMVAALLVKAVGWAVAAGFAAAIIIFWLLRRIIRKKNIKRASCAGHINRNGLVTGKCITPGWQYDQCFYQLECSSCGHVHDVRADRIPKEKCPACQEKRGK